jgi:hypothetical protein
MGGYWMEIADYKRRALEKRLAQLLEEHQAATEQLGRTLAAVDTIRLKRQVEALESEIEEVNRELKGQSSAAGSPAVSPPASAGAYDLAAVRDLLLQAFTAADFRRLFLYTGHPDLRSLVQEFGDGEGLATMVDRAIEYCVTRDLLLDLLREVQGANPRMYGRYEPRLSG